MWYGVCVLSVSIHDNKQYSDALWEEQLFLVEALHEEDARKKGMEFAIASMAEYRNVEGELIRWTFDRVESIYEILEPELKSGAEVFSRFLREPQVRALVESPSP